MLGFPLDFWDYLTFAVLMILGIAFLIVLVFILGLPGRIAIARKHPDAEAVTRASSNSFFSSFVFASAFHHDPRFFPQSHPTFWGSVKYSATQIVISRNDSGKRVVNSSGLLGPLAAEGLANVYLPVSEQTIGKTFERYGTDTAWKFAGNMFKNYWPTIFRRYKLNRLVILPAPQPADSPVTPTS